MYEAMRRALVDHARKRKTQAAKQRSRTVRIEDLEFNELAQTADKYPERIDALVLALDRLAVSHPEWVEVIKHRYFGGLTIKTIARIMAKGEKTIRRWWQQARLRLHREVLGILNGEETDDEELS
jgi:DNA-directed RNA polymerase specialized sigma24 family protein